MSYRAAADHIAKRYAKKLADYEAAITQRNAKQDEEREIRHRTALIAELLSIWITTDGTDRQRLNELSFQAFLWLPEDIAKDLSNTLAHKVGAPSVRDLLVRVRKHLIGEHDQLPANDVIVFLSNGQSTPQLTVSYAMNFRGRTGP